MKGKSIFTRSLVVIILLVIMVCGIRVKALASPSSTMHRSYTSVQIQSGDTLWSIAEQYCGSSRNKDIRSYVKDLKQMNHIENDYSLQTGAYLMIYLDMPR